MAGECILVDQVQKLVAGFLCEELHYAEWIHPDLLRGVVVLAYLPFSASYLFTMCSTAWDLSCGPAESDQLETTACLEASNCWAF